MLPYLEYLTITDKHRNKQGSYSFSYIKYEEEEDEVTTNAIINPLPGIPTMNTLAYGKSDLKSISAKVQVVNFSLTKEHILTELELKFVELALANQKQQHVFAVIEGVQSTQLYFDVIKNDYVFRDPADFRKFLTRLLAWGNYLQSKSRLPYKKVVVHPVLFEIISAGIDDTYNNRLDIYVNPNLPKNKIIYLSDNLDHGACQYVTDGQLNDIILFNGDSLATVDLLSVSDIRDQKIDKIFE